MTCNNLCCCHNGRIVNLRAALGNARMVASEIKACPQIVHTHLHDYIWSPVECVRASFTQLILGGATHPDASCCKHERFQVTNYRPLSRRLDRCDRVIQNESRDPFGGNVYYVTMQIAFLTRKFRNRERNLHCDIVHTS